MSRFRLLNLKDIDKEKLLSFQLDDADQMKELFINNRDGMTNLYLTINNNIDEMIKSSKKDINMDDILRLEIYIDENNTFVLAKAEKEDEQFVKGKFYVVVDSILGMSPVYVNDDDNSKVYDTSMIIKDGEKFFTNIERVFESNIKYLAQRQ